MADGSDPLAESSAGYALPDSFKHALGKLSAEDEIGVWRLDSSLTPQDLDPVSPVNLWPVGSNGMGDWLCLLVDRWSNDAETPVVMWNPEARRWTALGKSFEDFLEKESLRRIEFLLERTAPLSAENVRRARQGESVSLEGIEEDHHILAELLGDVCRIAAKLGLSEAVFSRAQGESGSPDFLREVDGRDEAGIDSAAKELEEVAKGGDAAPAFEVLGFLQLRQKGEDVARWAFLASKCSMFSWPPNAPKMAGKVADLLKGSSAAIPAVERLDPLFSFMTTQPVAKPEGRLNLAKQYLRKKDFRGALREAENGLVLAADLDQPAGLRSALELMIEIFKLAGRPREEAYAASQLARLNAV